MCSASAQLTCRPIISRGCSVHTLTHTPLDASWASRTQMEGDGTAKRRRTRSGNQAHHGSTTAVAVIPLDAAANAAPHKRATEFAAPPTGPPHHLPATGHATTGFPTNPPPGAEYLTIITDIPLQLQMEMEELCKTQLTEEVTHSRLDRQRTTHRRHNSRRGRH